MNHPPVTVKRIGNHCLFTDHLSFLTKKVQIQKKYILTETTRGLLCSFPVNQTYMYSCTCVKLYSDFGLCYLKSKWQRLPDERTRMLYFNRLAAQDLPALCSRADPESELCRVSIWDRSKPHCKSRTYRGFHL